MTTQAKSPARSHIKKSEQCCTCHVRKKASNRNYCKVCWRERQRIVQREYRAK